MNSSGGIHQSVVQCDENYYTAASGTTRQHRASIVDRTSRIQKSRMIESWKTKGAQKNNTIINIIMTVKSQVGVTSRARYM